MYFESQTEPLKFKDNVGKNLKANDRKFVVKFSHLYPKKNAKNYVEVSIRYLGTYLPTLQNTEYLGT